MVVSAVVLRFSMVSSQTHVVKQDELVGPAAIEIADGVEETVPDQSGPALPRAPVQRLQPRAGRAARGGGGVAQKTCFVQLPPCAITLRVLHTPMDADDDRAPPPIWSPAHA